jgi:serine/threonine protein phosphatase PrpC
MVESWLVCSMVCDYEPTLSRLLSLFCSGHSGPYLSNRLSQELHKKIAEHIKRYPVDGTHSHAEWIERSFIRAFLDFEIEVLDHVYNLYPESEVKQMTEKRVVEIWERAEHEQRERVLEALSGSCVLMVYVDEEKIVTANIGDSHAVR